MRETSDVESYGEGHRTFDCPWCGAICGVAPDHIGEHFECPECHKRTKLTEATLRDRPLTGKPQEAPHHEEGEAAAEKEPLHETSDWESYGKGHRTFDCPWCGAISGIDPSHIGEHFDCPECHKGTKLTPDNTRAGHVTEPAPDAPHHEEKSKAPMLMIVAIAVVVGIVGVVMATGGGDEGSGDGDGTEIAKKTEPAVEPGEAPTDVPAPTPPAEEPPAEEPPAEEPPAEEPPAEEPPAEAPPVSPVEAAQARLDEAKKALEVWEQANPGYAKLLGRVAVCEVVGTEANRLRTGLEGVEITPEKARAFNEAMRTFVSAEPDRVELLEILVTQLNKEPLKPLLLESWEGVNFFNAGLCENLSRVAKSSQALVPAEHARLKKAVAEAEAARAAASGEVAPGD